MKNLFKKENGITLIALIITIVVMLILVVVSIQIALETGLFESAGKATKNWEEAQDSEQELGSGKVTIGGITYNSIEEYTSSIYGGNAEVDFEKLFATAEKHPEQTMTNDIGIAEDGSIVNLDLWIYEKSSEEDGWNLEGESYDEISSYDKTKIIDGKIIGQVPMYVKKDGEEFYPVTCMSSTFSDCRELEIAPEIPSSVTEMDSTFVGCTSLTKAPKIPSSVTSMRCTFLGCTSLTEAPEIPSLVTNMFGTFEECTSLTEAPEIPSSVTDMSYTFSDCTSLTEAPAIPSSVTDMSDTFSGCTSLTEAPEIPSSVTCMDSTFEDCTSLTEAPAIPSSVTNIQRTFWGCTSLTEAPVIPSSVTNMNNTFYNCTSLTGTLTINANPTSYSNCLSGAATNEGCNLVLNGSSTKLNEILATANGNPNITIGN